MIDFEIDPDDYLDALPEVDDPNVKVKLDCGPCHHCDRKYPGSDRNGGHCATCHLSFASQTGFDKHLRPGRYKDKTQPFCLTAQELEAKGWTIDAHHVVRMPAPTHWNTTEDKK